MDDIILNKPVVRLETDEHARNYKWNNGSEKLSPNLQILSFDDFSEWAHEGTNRNMIPSNCVCGDILVKHPFQQDVYVKLDSLEEAVYNDKGFIISDIARLLGCKNFKWDVNIGDVTKREIGTDGNVKYVKYAEADFSYKKDLQESIKSKLNLDQNMTGVYSYDDYEKAIEEAKKCNLWQEVEIRTLIEGRNPNSAAKITSRKVSIELSKETNEATDISFTLNVMTAFSMAFKYHEIIDIRKTVNLECTMEF